LNADHCHGFHTSQLIDYILEPSQDTVEGNNALPQKMAVAFYTADFVVLGWRLSCLSDLFRSIKITPIEKR
jgi:hypothetical protein